MLSIWNIDVPDYSTLNRRIRKLTIPVDIDASSRVYELAIDSTGYKVSNRGDWISGRRGGNGYINK